MTAPTSSPRMKGYAMKVMSNEELKALVGEVVPHLEGDWQYVAIAGRDSVTITDGVVTLTFYPRKEGRVEVGQDIIRSNEGYVNYRDENGEAVENPGVEVNANTKRGAKHVAEHVNRRVLPGARRYVEVANKKIAADRAFNVGVAVLAAKLAGIKDELFTLRKTDYNRNEIKYPNEIKFSLTGERWSQTVKYGYGDIQVNSANSVQMELRSLHPELAEAIMKAIEGWYAAQPDGPREEEAEEDRGVTAVPR